MNHSLTCQYLTSSCAHLANNIDNRTDPCRMCTIGHLPRQSECGGPQLHRDMQSFMALSQSKKGQPFVS